MAPKSTLLSLLWLSAILPSGHSLALQGRDTPPTFVGWGKDTVGGTAASASSTYTVSSFSALKTALQNGGSPNSPKIIYIQGTIDGGILSSGATATEAYYSSGTSYNWNLYLQSFNQTYRDQLTAAGDTTTLALLNAQESARSTSASKQKAQIAVSIPSYTTIIGLKTGSTPAKIQGASLSLSSVQHVILRNFEIEAPVDYFPKWDPTDGATGNWNSLYDAIGLTGATNVGIDHVTVTDGTHPDDQINKVFGQVVQRHDGAIDIGSASDLVTVQHSIINHHDKSMLIGSSDSATSDAGKLRVTIYANYFKDSLERSPRVRYGKVHVYNNYYEASISNYLVYCIGMGINSAILSESNYFNIGGASSVAQAGNYVIGQYKGYNFKDTGSLINGSSSVNLETVASSLYQSAAQAEIAAAAAAGRSPAEWATHTYTNAAFTPTYTYTVIAATSVQATVLGNVGPQ